MRPLSALLSLIIFMTPAWADLHKFDLHPNTLGYDVSVILVADNDTGCEKNSKSEVDAYDCEMLEGGLEGTL